MSNFRQSVWEFVKFIVITLLIVVPLRLYIAQPFIVSGASMVPTFKDGDYLIVDELSYYLREPKRGEVVVFRFPRDPAKYFIKRIIGLPGETVTIADNKILIESPGRHLVLKETYITDRTYPNLSQKLGAGEFFVLGDNREESYDSRLWGPVTAGLLKGRAFLRLFPFRSIQLLPGEVSEQLL